ncbi:sortase [Sinomonas halotolerans]|uniref:Sortase n=1 Tax=Sinomonas halotolerans TaxID=1644133 RepID=A0ABU9X0F2_9MICC
MTAGTVLEEPAGAAVAGAAEPSSRRRVRPVRRPRPGAVPPPSTRPKKPSVGRAPVAPWRMLLSMVLTMLATVITLQLINLVGVSPLLHATAQERLYEELRLSLSEGSAPLGQTTFDGALVAPGTPLALLSIPDIGVREVVVEGTASAQTMLGAGHRRDTPLPGQTGTSVLMGRSGAYGGVFRSLHDLAPGSRFTLTTGQGEAAFEVMGLRRAGDQAPPAPLPTEGRLTLITADGPAFMPEDVLRVDAKLVSKPFEKAAPVLVPGSLPGAEQAMGQDTTNLFTLVLCLQLLILVSVAAVWSWTRWGRRETWLVFVPALTAAGLITGTNVNFLLPNLL